MTQNMKKKYQFLSGTALKIAASAIMLADHIGAALIYRYIVAYIPNSHPDFDRWNRIYLILRCVGRSAFPIFCFLIAEGFRYTADRKKYLLRMGIFALLSEYPFQLAFQGITMQRNVFFTLFLGLAVLWGMEALAENKYFREQKGAAAMFMLSALQVLIALVGAGAAVLLRSDYGLYGVLAIIVFYVFRDYRALSVLAGFFVLLNISSAFCLPGCLLILLYNGKRGGSGGHRGFWKYFFYLFYPAHLLVLYAVWRFI